MAYHIKIKKSNTYAVGHVCKIGASIQSLSMSFSGFIR